MTANVLLTGYTGIVVTILTFFTLVVLCHKIINRESKFNNHTEIPSSIDENFSFFYNKIDANDCPIQNTTFKSGDVSEMQKSFLDSKKFKI
jgi:hypothetical protein